MLALRLAAYLLVCDGVASLFLAGLIGPLGAGLVVLAVLGSWWIEGARERGAVRAWGAWGLVAPAAAWRVGFRSQLARVSLVAAATTFVLTGMLFFVIPRMGQAALPIRAQFSRMVTGFSDRVELGAFGEIETDKTVVMRVYVSDDIEEPSLLPGLRWRGIVFDRFDGRTWAVGRPARVPLRRW